MKPQIEYLANIWANVRSKKDGVVSYTFTESALDVFAEMIVKECAKVVSIKTGPKSALNILEHFGVEE